MVNRIVTEVNLGHERGVTKAKRGQTSCGGAAAFGSASDRDSSDILMVER